MEYRPLGNTGPDISAICLGTMTWGEQNTESDGHEQLDYAIDQGVNFVDTAEMYAIPTRAETYGATEKIIGSWLASRRCRDRIVLATKVLGPTTQMTWVRDGKSVPDRKNIVAACDASLKRLRTDYIDLYQIHWPARNTNCFGRLGYVHDPDDRPVPIEESHGAMADLIRQGKIRHFGLSNETPWGVMAFLRSAERNGLPRPQSVQNPYSLLNRTYEIGLAEMSIRENVGLLAYSPLGFGVLSGKYLSGARPRGARLTEFGHRFPRYQHPRVGTATERYVAIARGAGIDPAQMALAYCLRQPFVTSVIIGATTRDQLTANIGAKDLVLPEDVRAAIEAVHRENPSPAP